MPFDHIGPVTNDTTIDELSRLLGERPWTRDPVPGTPTKHVFELTFLIAFSQLDGRIEEVEIEVRRAPMTPVWRGIPLRGSWAKLEAAVRGAGAVPAEVVPGAMQLEPGLTLGLTGPRSVETVAVVLSR